MTFFEHKFFEDDNPTSNTAVDSSLFADKTLQRDIWGLVIFSGKSNRYYCVGAFISRAVHGGSDIFCGTEGHKIAVI